MAERNEPNRIYHYTIDTEGRLWIEGTELTDSSTLKFFMRRMEKLPEGNYRVMCMGETNLIKAEDVPYVVQTINIQDDKIELCFSGNYRETLDPSNLWVGKDNILYCKVRKGDFDARFNRKPYLELAKLVDRDSEGNYYLSLGGQHYPISGVIEKM